MNEVSHVFNIWSRNFRSSLQSLHYRMAEMAEMENVYILSTLKMAVFNQIFQSDSLSTRTGNINGWQFAIRF